MSEQSTPDSLHPIAYENLPTIFESKSKRTCVTTRVAKHVRRTNPASQYTLPLTSPPYRHTPASLSPNTPQTISSSQPSTSHTSTTNKDGDDVDLLVQLDNDETVLPIIPRNFEYGDHTADIILHGYGSTIEQTFESVAYAMISYMFDHPDRIEIHPLLTHDIYVEANDIPELVFRYLTEILVQGVDYLSYLPDSLQKHTFSHISFPGMIPRIVKVKSFIDNDANFPTNENDENGGKRQASFRYQLVVRVLGDFIDTVKLGAGTEIKAITKELTHLRMILDEQEIKQKGHYHLQVLVDI